MKHRCAKRKDHSMEFNGTTLHSYNNISVDDYSFAKYFRVEIATSIMLVILSPLTVAANSLLLSAIYKDPLRCFRTPTTFFIVGLALSDLVTGLVVEPAFILKYLAYNSQCGLKANCTISYGFELIYRIGGIISTIAISSSFIVVLGLSISQYIAITYPHRYKKVVTKQRVISCVVLSWFYFVCFSLLQFSGIDHYTYLKIDLILHASSISILIGVVHSLLYFSFKRHLTRSHTWRRRTFYEKQEANGKGGLFRGRGSNKENKSRQNERQFTIVTFYLAGILLLAASTHNIVLYVYFFLPTAASYRANIYILVRVSDLMLFFKVALDPFIYAWRLPTYRKALKLTIWTANTDQPPGRLSVLFKQENSKRKWFPSKSSDAVHQTGVMRG